MAEGNLRHHARFGFGKSVAVFYLLLASVAITGFLLSHAQALELLAVAALVVGCVFALRHLTDHRAETEEALRVRDRAIESTRDGIIITDALDHEHRTLYVNPALERITGYPPAEVIGRNARFFLGDGRYQPEAETLRQMLRGGREGTVILRCQTRDGQPFWNELSVSPVRDEQGIVTHYISIFKDITERRRQEEEMLRNAHHDTLTGLANRVLLHDRLEQAITVAHRHQRQVGVLFVDLDHFKIINDTLGLAIGDAMLREVAARLLGSLRDGDTAARIGADEFVLLLNDMEQEDDIVMVAERVLQSMTRPHAIQGQELFVSASIGASIYPRDGDDGQELLKKADIAMVRAKEHGRNGFQVFTEEMQSRISQRLSLETHLRRALDRQEFLLHYQPQVCLETGAIVGAEALIRWQHPELGMVSPAEFIPLAEDTGLIVVIGEWVIEAACAQMKAWRDSGLADIGVSVNLSARQFRLRNLAETVERHLTHHGIPPHQLDMELTESMVMQDPEAAILTLRQFTSLGLRISLDDFGTGYSSLSHLKRFPINVLKVDQSFVREVTTDKDAAAIAASIIALGRSLDLKVIAEGVETREQLDYLKRHECDEIQGYYFSKPLPATDFAALLQSGRRLEP
ncbi:MAG: EAL domain-containing protein [Rhodocyclaceae bacterium]|nr:EAL domain-containing protein [Rhodocyclaceae bacterium]